MLNATDVELSSKTSADVKRTLNEINNSLIAIRELISNGVNKLLQMEVECFTRVNLTVCEEIINGHAAFRLLLQQLAEHFAQAEYLQSILNGRPQVLQVIRQKLLEVNSQLTVLEAEINRTALVEAEEAIDLSTSSDAIEVTSCPGVGRIKFAFDSRKQSSDCQEDTESNCIDVAIPLNATNRDLWNVRSCSVDSELNSFRTLSSFVNLMNTIHVKITASLQKVKVHRTWFDDSIFEDDKHYTMVG